ncbi:MAG TPA: choice-of-anchor D domain-containing protein, partial [Ignavibacteria bacterium]|nr:choice-of-anchor D domain-containing protein [Ignavibacteria bacterium]
MKNVILVSILAVFFATCPQSQTLISTYSFPASTAYNGFWGITQINDTLWIGSSSTGKLYKVTKTGTILDSISTPFTFNQGLAWDGTGFWIARNAGTTNSRVIKVNMNGSPVDTIRITSLSGNQTIGIGGIAKDGNNLWLGIYYPDFTVYPFSYAYKVDLTTKLIVDTIPLRGSQIQGIAVKGDTIFYVNDNFQSEPERIYAYRKAVGDTIYSFPAPDPDNDCDPRGMFWDGQNLFLMAYRVGTTTGQFRNLYKYALTGLGSPVISTSQTNIDFGNTLIGTTNNRNLTINNSGTGKLIINGFTMTNNRFSITPGIVPDTIQAGQLKNYNIGFTPNVFDTTSGELRISSNDAGNPVKVVTLRGKGVYTGSYIGISTQNFNYSNRRVNSLCGFTFSVTNLGSQPLVLNSVSFSTARYKFDTINNQFPITIDTQKTRVLRIWFNPNSASTFNDSAIFSTNAVNNGTAKIILSGTGISNATALGDILWEGTIPDNPCTSSDDFQPKSMKQINDVNGDGVHEMIVATENYWTICYNGNSSVTADTLWKFQTCFGTNNTGSVDWEDAMWIMDDINNDGIQEVVIGTGGGNENVYVISGSNGQVIWWYGDPVPTNNYQGDVNGLRVDKDYNNDGKKDVILVATGEGPSHPESRRSVICLNGLNGQVIFSTQLPAEFLHDVASLTTGAAVDFSSNGGPYGIRGVNNSGALTWSYSVSSTVWSLRQFPDINSDGNSDVIGFYGFTSGIFALSGSTGQPIWATTLGGGNNGTVEPVDDKDKNGFIDIVFSGPQNAYRIDSKNGNIIWSQVFSASYIRDAGFLGDVTGDTLGEVLFSTQQPGNVYVLNGQNGNILFQYSFGSSLNQRADRVNALASIDGNPTSEFVAGCRDGRIKCFSGGPGFIIGII